MKCYIEELFTESEKGDAKESGVKYIIGSTTIPPENLAQDYCDKQSMSINNFDMNELEKLLKHWQTMELLDQDIILLDSNEIICTLETIKTLKEIAEHKNINIIICKDFNGKRNRIFQETTYYDGRLPDIDEGVGLLFSTSYPKNVLIEKMLGRDKSHDNILYVINCDGPKIQKYYSKLIDRCMEIDSVMRFSNMYYTTSPKTIFCFDSIESYKNFKSGFDKLTDDEEIAKWMLAYGSDSNIVLNMSVSVDLGWRGEIDDK